MSNRTLIYLLIVGVVAMAALLVTNFIGKWKPTYSEKYLSRNDVRGIDIDHNGKLWTLNFDQQNKVITVLNASISSNDYFAPEKTNFDKMVIYRFNKPDIVLTPLKIVNKQLIFTVPEWDQKVNLKESNPGELQQILSQTYDH